MYRVTKNPHKIAGVKQSKRTLAAKIDGDVAVGGGTNPEKGASEGESICER